MDYRTKEQGRLVLQSESHTAFAHTKADTPPSDWHRLSEHLIAVGKRAAEFASSFGGEEWAFLAGQWHDLGKYADTFQNYLLNATAPDLHIAEITARHPKTDHSTAGAQHAVDQISSPFKHILAFVIAGHHAGLLDTIGEGASLEARLNKKISPWKHDSHEIFKANLTQTIPKLIHESLNKNGANKKTAFTAAFFTRMIFSCLVDADYLDTEAFMDINRAKERDVYPENILELINDQLNEHISHLPILSKIDRIRHDIYRECISAAQETQGLFSLTVPTGGGKTLSSLAFALKHALIHGMKRIIYVIPFTSIIEQNAIVFKEVFSELRNKFGELVIEHHSTIDIGQETVKSRLASENWNAPIIVTTSVQFYESLFSNRTSKCRKLHNIANSVVILDEAQTLPVNMLHPCISILEELTTNYNTTIVLCTATQPAINNRDKFEIGLKNVREIIKNPNLLYEYLERINFKDLKNLTDDELIIHLKKHKQVLCIVNTRNHARLIFEKLSKEIEYCFHLSAQMCPEHRNHTLKKIHQRLLNGLECYVISTQIIEAGVDIDFPVVYRSMSGIDSITQAGGRCNRNGTIEEKGEFYLFRSEHISSEKIFSEQINAASQTLALYENPFSLAAVELYFQLYYWDQQDRWDEKKILDDFQLCGKKKIPVNFQFQTVSNKFKIIDDYYESIIIPWGRKGVHLCDQIRYSDPEAQNRKLLRQLQRFTVQIPKRIYEQQKINGGFEIVNKHYAILLCPEINYSNDFGINFNLEPTHTLIF